VRSPGVRRMSPLVKMVGMAAEHSREVKWVPRMVESPCQNCSDFVFCLARHLVARAT
jgi:hypothetical protein